MRTEPQITAIVTRAMKNLHLDLAKKWGFPISTIAHATFRLGITLLTEVGCNEEQILEEVRQFMASLVGPPSMQSTP